MKPAKQSTSNAEVRNAPNVVRRQKVVLLGMASWNPWAGVVWQTIHYLVGFQRLGFDVYYVEAHGSTPYRLMQDERDDASDKAAAFIARMLGRFDLGDHWAYQTLDKDGRCYGMSDAQLRQLYSSAALIINLHGGTQPLPEHRAAERLVYLETDPCRLQIELYRNEQQAADLLSPHDAFFTFGENYGHCDCGLPISERFSFKPTRQPVVTDFWRRPSNGAGNDAFTTIGNWKQVQRDIEFQGETYHWSKHLEFLKFIDLPRRTGQRFELALSRYSDKNQQLLEGKRWHVRDAVELSQDIDSYRDYICSSRGEFTVAKDQNIRLRSGWFSDRSATYLAAGRPVVTQETGFSNALPTGEGLFGFSTMDEIVDAVDQINGDYERHSRAASAIAREYFNYDVVLTQLLDEVGL